MKIKEMESIKTTEKVGFGDVFIIERKTWGFRDIGILAHTDNNEFNFINLENGNREFKGIKIPDLYLVELINNELDLIQLELTLKENEINDVKLTKVNATLEVEQ